jgi:iron(III) transport system substrate-binding protein
MRNSYQLPILLAVGLALLASGCGPREAARTELIVYCAQDQVYAEPLLAAFTRETGIRVRALYDSEAVKTVGLANRLLAEQRHPQCDVFWGNEELRTRQMAAAGVFAETNGWTAFGQRSRRLVVNTNVLSLDRAPRSLRDLTNRVWQGRVALAYPLFGTTATHFLALRQRWGAAAWGGWCRALAANRPFLVEGNSVAAKLVARGEAWIGLTDSDDVEAERREGAPLAVLPLDEDSLLIPNTVGLVRKPRLAPGAEELCRFLASSNTVARLCAAHALEASGTAAGADRTLKPDWPRLLGELEGATAEMCGIFLR